MPQTCSICRHPERAVVEAALLRGESLRDIAGRHGLAKSAVARHKADHLPAAMVKAHAAAEVADADDLLRQAGLLRTKAISLLLMAERSGDLRTALSGVREARSCIELLARLLGELKEGPTVNVTISPAWVLVRGAIVAALAPFPEARTVVAGDLALALDPVLLARRAGLEPDGWQASVLRSNARQAILLCSRQSGKSTTTAVLATHQAVYAPGSLVLLLSPSLRQSQELYRKVRDVYAAVGGAGPRPAEESALRLELANGSRVVSLPGSEATIRGYSGVALLIVDEASRVNDDLYMAIRPMLAVSGGRIVLLSTPQGKRGFFHHEWSAGGPAWERVRVTAADCGRISAAWLGQERASLPGFVFRQEYGCEFVQADDAFFDADDVRAALTPELVPLALPEGWQ